MQATKKFKFRTLAFGTVTIHARNYDAAYEEFLRRGYAETDILEIV